jgi:hypothetical protein
MSDIAELLRYSWRHVTEIDKAKIDLSLLLTAAAEIESLRSRLAAADALLKDIRNVGIVQGTSARIDAHLAGSAPKGRVYTEADGDCPHGVPLWQHCSSCPAGATAARET